MNSLVSGSAVVGILLTFIGAAQAYEQRTHRGLTEAAVIRWMLEDHDARTRIGLKLQLTDPRRQFPNSKGVAGSVITLFNDGAEIEDDGVTARNHFFNPLDGSSGIGFTPSPDWALEDRSPIGAQVNSLRDARDYYRLALTAPTFPERRKNYGLLFQTLGHVAHHLQDMAQPQHVRADKHCDALYCVGPLHNPSLYEYFTLAAGIPAGLATSARLPDEGVALRQPRELWIDAGRGLAEYTNKGFVSAGTNFLGRPLALRTHPGFPWPDGSGLDVRVLSGKDIKATVSCIPALLLPAIRDDDVMKFVGTPVTDRRLDLTDFNPKTSTFSIFDDPLEKRGASMVFSLNRFNFCEAHKLLLPRAVSYSAALFKYFFRGALELAAPPEGVFAIADQGAALPPDRNFRRIKVNVRNVSPDRSVGGGGYLGAGSLYAIVKYNLNSCFRPDLSGEFGAPNFLGPSCRKPGAPEDIIAVSTPKDVAAGRVGDAFETHTFEFPFDRVPVNATDVYLQVVFHGRVGADSDAIAVGTVDLNEPTFFIFGNHHDYLAYFRPDGSFSKATRYPGEKLLSLGLWFNEGLATPIAAIPEIDVGRYTNVAVLTNQDALSYSVKYLSTGEVATRHATYSLRGSHNQLDDDDNPVLYPRYSPLRSTSATDWLYQGPDGNALFWVQWACDGDYCPIVPTHGKVAQSLPPMASPTPAPMAINF